MPILNIVNTVPLLSTNECSLPIEVILEAANNVNATITKASTDTSKMAFDVFKIIDFRMISGLIGELLVVEISNLAPWLKKNPNIDGYPDLLNLSTEEAKSEYEIGFASRIDKFIAFKFGGFEIKNTFGTKKAKSELLYGSSRIGRINKKLDWKAHHRKTNNLIGLHSDFENSVPQIFAISFSNELTEKDWKEKQDPGEGSTMTSFSVIERSGWNKMRTGLRICSSDPAYISFYEDY